MIPPFDVIVPVRNEEVQLRETARALRIALKGLPATVIYSLNDTTDNSRTVIQSIFGPSAHILQQSSAGKAHALRAADAESNNQLRIYLDADIRVRSDIFPALLRPLIDGHADLTAARLVVDLSRSSGLALRVNRVWADQLARREDAFMCCTAVNAVGLKQRGLWPDLLADDDWARNRIDPSRRLIVETAQVDLTPPKNLKSWIKVRARWIRGTKELKNFEENYIPAERVRPRGAYADLATYYIIRLSAEVFALMQKNTQHYWGRDDSTRDPNNV